ncbi:type I-F CRISPR-associated endoribonuclease Cas6/Csy4 [Pseudomonas sp. 5P_3.1_Bac2]|uniref:type I-F CRISPR-associated endoribonuclease Cas6/Csy4 n=1 Tax=Pseudomonas sp. 5P_3.1_Bac2 TaxID=2971617 RepID=UPI0021C65306|nr:type I-F CRISPR-associated endoribonuclease Cas6/Csy4 [Pseudomonas sp. 5P_3.1_Bac2]MCU1718624.1 type I-F CRISPR-associated endoribonuclease Cas6/Csy4 [Pseudomonas sp. 5P_3.1_Bac2]
MDHYLDLKLLPDPEFAQAQLMSALFSKLHRGLSDLRRNDVGISFPTVKSGAHGLGDCLRVHGPADALQHLLTLNWLTGMRDHVQISAVSAVPATAKHRAVSRVQVDSNPERARRRLIKRHGISEAEAKARIPDSAAKRSDLPYVITRSNSSGQPFHLFIRHGPLLNSPQPGAFNQYGLSSTATVPWF